MGIHRINDWLSVSLREDMNKKERYAKTLLILMLFANVLPKDEKYSYGSFSEKDVITLLSLCFLSDMQLTDLKYKSINSKESFLEKIVETSIQIGPEVQDCVGAEKFGTLSLPVGVFKSGVSFILSYHQVSTVMGSSIQFRDVRYPNVEYEFFLTKMKLALYNVNQID